LLALLKGQAKILPCHVIRHRASTNGFCLLFITAPLWEDFSTLPNFPADWNLLFAEKNS
jgi:hypothetical protein